MSNAMMKVERYFGNYKNKSDEYRMEKKRVAVDNQDIVANKQYFFIYLARVYKLTPMILNKARHTISKNAIVDLLLSHLM